MPKKELVTNLKPMINDGLNDIILSESSFKSITVLYDGGTNGYIKTDTTATLNDSILNYDAIIVEAAAYNASTKKFFINSSYFIKPLVIPHTDGNYMFSGYLLDIFYSPDKLKRILASFPTDMTVKVMNGENTGVYEFDLGIRNIYGVINKMVDIKPQIYSTNPIPIGTWIDGKTIYRKYIDVTDKVKIVGFNHIPFTDIGLDDLEKCTDLRGFFIRKNGASFPIPFTNYTQADEWYSHLIINPTELEVRVGKGLFDDMGKVEIIIEYTKKVV